MKLWGIFNLGINKKISIMLKSVIHFFKIIIIVDKQLCKLNPIDNTDEVSHTLNILKISKILLGPYSRNDDPRSRMREVLAVSF